jgi:hypothetical protein
MTFFIASAFLQRLHARGLGALPAHPDFMD